MRDPAADAEHLHPERPDPDLPARGHRRPAGTSWRASPATSVSATASFIGVGGVHRRHPGRPLGRLAVPRRAAGRRRGGARRARCSASRPAGHAGPAFVIVTFAMLELLGLDRHANWSSVTGGSQGLLMPLPDWDVRFHNWPFYYALLALLAGERRDDGLDPRAPSSGSVWSRSATTRTRRPASAWSRRCTRRWRSWPAPSWSASPAPSTATTSASSTVGAMFDIVLSMQVVLAVLLGGRGTVWGPVLGAFIVRAADRGHQHHDRRAWTRARSG